jgi:hypothetical protein
MEWKIGRGTVVRASGFSSLCKAVMVTLIRMRRVLPSMRVVSASARYVMTNGTH